jgi:hypothetical protein
VVNRRPFGVTIRADDMLVMPIAQCCSLAEFLKPKHEAQSLGQGESYWYALTSRVLPEVRPVSKTQVTSRHLSRSLLSARFAPQ